MKEVLFTLVIALTLSYVFTKLFTRSYDKHLKNEAEDIILSGNESVYLEDIKKAYVNNDMKQLRTAIDNYNAWQNA